MIVTITKSFHQDSERAYLDPVRSMVKLGAMLKVLIPVNGEQKITDGEKLQGACCVNACSQCTVTNLLLVCGVVIHVRSGIYKKCVARVVIVKNANVLAEQH